MISANNLISKNKIVGALINVMILVSTTVLFLMLAEWYVRMFKPQPLIPRYVIDAPYGVLMNQPNIDTWHITKEYKINMRTNSKGIRTDREIGYEKPPGMKRIVALGDSYTLGYGVNLEDLFLTRLENKLNEQGVSAEIINLGVNGFSNAEELVTLENEGLKYGPDLILLAYYQNDLGDNVVSGLYRVEGHELIRAQKEYLPKSKLRNFLHSFGIYRYLTEKSQLLYLIRSNIAKQIRSSSLKKRELGLNQKEVSADADQLILGAKIIGRIYEVAEDKNIPFLLVDIPSRSLTSNIPIEQMTYLDQIHFFDSAKILKKVPKDILLYWKKSDGHWTPTAHRIVGERLAEFIIEHNLLEKLISVYSKRMQKVSQFTFRQIFFLGTNEFLSFDAI